MGTVAVWGNNSGGQTAVPGGLSGVQAIAAGGEHTVALKGDGTVVSWGNGLGGDMTVPAGLTEVTAISASVTHTVALKSDGTVVTWGYSSPHLEAPVGLADVRAISAGYDYTLVLKNDGTVVSWGYTNWDLANVAGTLTDVTAIAAGQYHALALKSDGTVVGWGFGLYGQATPPEGLTDVVAIAAGYSHSVALKSDGTVVAWGEDSVGQATVPEGLTDVSAIAAGERHTVALKKDGTVVAWGYNGLDQTNVPVGLKGVRAISAGGYTTAVLRDASVDFGEGLVATKGETKTFTIRNTGNAALQIFSVSVGGNDASDFAVDTLGTATDIPAATGETTFSVSFTPSAGGLRQATLQVFSTDSDEFLYSIHLTGTGISTPEISINTGSPVGAVVGWGDDSHGQSTPPADLADVKAIATGGVQTMALKNDGTVVGWGSSPNVPEGLTGVTAIASRVYHTMALKSDGSVVVWNIPSGVMAVPAGLTGVTAIAAGSEHLVALKGDGTVVAWGWNTRNQTNVPVALTGVTAIAAGRYHTVALKGDGTVAAWGDDSAGQATVPVGLTGVTAVSAGDSHTVALKSDGTVIAWGDNGFGQTNVPAGLTGVTAVAAGSGHTVALKNDGTVVAWGWNTSGQATVPDGLTGVKAIAAGHANTVVLRDPSVTFGNQIVTTPSTPKTLSIRNIGAGELTISGVLVEGGNASDFTVNTSGMLPNVPGATGETTFTVTFTPSAAGLRQTTLRVTSNDSDEGSYEIPLTGTGVAAPPLETWRQLHFGITVSAGNAADHADANKNGIANLIEYALGGDPVGFTTRLGILPQSSKNASNHQQLTFSYDSSRTGTTLTVQAGDDLGSWTDLARSVNGAPFAIVTTGAEVIEIGDAGIRTVTVGDLYAEGDVNHPTRFMRLRVSRP